MRFTQILVVALAACVGFPHPAATAGPDRSPRLVVILIVDQMRGDYIDRYGQQWSKGLRRLLDRGAWFRQAAYPYAETVTCVGHSTVATGSYPMTHGIVDNSWYDRQTAQVTRCTDDPRATSFSYGDAVAGGESVANLRVPTLSDEMGAQLPAPPRVVSLSMKDYTAVTLAGHHGDAVAWFNATAHGFVTSSVFKRAPFLQQFFAAHPIEAELARTWTKALPDASYLYEDAGIGERPPVFWTASFPHPLSQPGQPKTNAYVAWETSPFADTYLGQLAEASVDGLGLGQGSSTDYLAISFSALDHVGHDFGPRSHEVQDVLVRLDDTLGRLLDHLDEKVGPDRYLVALTGDHGVAPIPEQRAAGGLEAGRVPAQEIVNRAQKAVEAGLGTGKYVARMVGDDLYFEAGVMQRLEEHPEVLKATIAQIEAIPGIARVIPSTELRNATSSPDAVRRAVAVNYYPGRSGDLMVIARPYWFVVGASGGSAATHGSPYGYDQHVPLIIAGSQVRPGQYLVPVSPADIAPTMAFLCGVTLPRADGRVLSEALTPTPSAAAARTGQ